MGNVFQVLSDPTRKRGNKKCIYMKTKKKRLDLKDNRRRRRKRKKIETRSSVER